MLRADAEVKSLDNLFKNINSVSLDTILKLQNDIVPNDMTSLVFLLYEVPDTALQRLIVYQRVSKDFERNNMNLLYDWALYAQSRPTWRYEFLEALCICRLYNVIRKLGFNVSNVKKHYLPENVYVNVYIDPVKKVLYNLCESMTSENYAKLKRTLTTYKIDVSEHETCEAVFLELMCQKFIKLGQYNRETKAYTATYDVELLIKIIKPFGALSKFATILREVQSQINTQNSSGESNASGTPVTKQSLNDSKSQNENVKESFDDIFKLLNDLHLEDVPIQNLKSDTTIIQRDAYIIKNKNRLGICCIINQENFHPSKHSIDRKEILYLEDRLGSTKDLYCLERTMSSLKFEVKSKSNLDHIEFIKFIKDVIQNDVKPEDSVFMLCILSHGVRGHVYAADSVKINVDDIKNMLDSDDAKNLHGVPKVLILQACQVEEDPEVSNKLVADGPNANYYLRKSHFLICWATAPEYEAYRIIDKGSLFIQCLCAKMKKERNEHLYDIFTKVTNTVTSLCTKLHKAQVPICESTLVKKLYIHDRFPEK
ncbi:jg1771 [Pararge aegeria aegeria]|uniref:Jg1771 protein n=5 Tax=Pararge aegeria TaxID=116150 RepID=A0A8S4RT59_9NEOP|nr:jg1771 [Pararge aegeria aegeria]